EQALADLKKRADEEKDPGKKAPLQDEARRLQEAADQLKAKLDKKDFAAEQKQYEEKDAYATDAYRLLMHPELCMKCHNVGNVTARPPQGRTRGLPHRRRRPE